MTEDLTKRQAEKERTSVLNMIPEKYRLNNTPDSRPTSTALSLVNALANN